jgi:hypothetical protein
VGGVSGGHLGLWGFGGSPLSLSFGGDPVEEIKPENPEQAAPDATGVDRDGSRRRWLIVQVRMERREKGKKKPERA